MKCIIEVLSGNTYESMRFAGQMLNLPVSEIKKSLASKDAYRAIDGKLYKFRESGARKTLTPTPLQRFPFGKYKGKLIFTCTDSSYLNWLINLENASARLKRPVRARLKTLNSKT